MDDWLGERLREPWHLRYHGLMPYRVREILLVSSPYDCAGSHGGGRGLSVDGAIWTGVTARVCRGRGAVQRLSPGVAILPCVLGHS